MYSRTARVSTVRWNLKEAVSESLVRRTEIAYKARLRVISWQRTAKSNNYHVCRSRVNAADIWRERACTLDRPSGLKYLGFGFYFDSRAHQFKAKPHAKLVAKFKKRMKELTCRSWGVSNSYKVEKLNQLIRGWINYFKIGSMKTLCKELDSRIRYRLRM